MSTVNIRVHARPTGFGGKAGTLLGKLPKDHVYISTDQGVYWGCFGGAQEDDSNPKMRIIAKGTANIDWMNEIAGSQCHTGVCRSGRCDRKECAGITHEATGICQSCANRLLLPAGIDVSDADGNELAILMFGKFGLGLSDLVERVKSAAERVNEKKPGSITQEEIDRAVGAVMSSKQSEREALIEDAERMLNLKIPKMSEEKRYQLRSIYEDLYNRRMKMYNAFKSKEITPDECGKALKKNFLDACKKMSRIIDFKGLFGCAPKAAVNGLFKK